METLRQSFDLTDPLNWILENVDDLIRMLGYEVNDHSKEVMQEFIREVIPEVKIWNLIASVVSGVLGSAGCKKLPNIFD